MLEPLINNNNNNKQTTLLSIIPKLKHHIQLKNIRGLQMDMNV